MLQLLWITGVWVPINYKIPCIELHLAIAQRLLYLYVHDPRIDRHSESF